MSLTLTTECKDPDIVHGSVSDPDYLYEVTKGDISVLVKSKSTPEELQDIVIWAVCGFGVAPGRPFENAVIKPFYGDPGDRGIITVTRA